MRWLLCIALLVGGCAGRQKPVTPDSVKRGRTGLHISLPTQLRFNQDYVVRIMLTGHDRHFDNALGYALVLNTGVGASTFVVYPYVRRYYEVKAINRGGLENRGSFTLTVKLHPVQSYNWKGDPLLGPSTLQAQQVVHLLGTEAD